MYEIIIWDGKPETAERIFKAVGEWGSHGTHLMFIQGESIMKGERVVVTKREWWKESVRYPRRVEPVSTSPEYVEKNAESVQVAGGAS